MILNQEFINDIPSTLHRFPTLSTVLHSGQKIIAGELIIEDNTGKEWDRYQVEIYPTTQYPYRFPLLFETGGRIPRIIDWHIYADTKSCCVDIRPSEIIHCRQGLHLPEYIDRYAIPYFANTTYRFREGYYKNGEYSHGAKGLLEYYTTLLLTRNPGKVLQILELFVNGAAGSKSIFHPCFCGSGKKLLCCHRDALAQLRIIGVLEVQSNASQIRDYLRQS